MSRSSVSPAIQISHLLTTQGSDPAREETACQTRNIYPCLAVNFSTLAVYWPDSIFVWIHLFRHSRWMKLRLPEHRHGDISGFVCRLSAPWQIRHWSSSSSLDDPANDLQKEGDGKIQLESFISSYMIDIFNAGSWLQNHNSITSAALIWIWTIFWFQLIVQPSCYLCDHLSLLLHAICSLLSVVYWAAVAPPRAAGHPWLYLVSSTFRLSICLDVLGPQASVADCCVSVVLVPIWAAASSCRELVVGEETRLFWDIRQLLWSSWRWWRVVWRLHPSVFTFPSCENADVLDCAGGDSGLKGLWQRTAGADVDWETSLYPPHVSRQESSKSSSSSSASDSLEGVSTVDRYGTVVAPPRKSSRVSAVAGRSESVISSVFVLLQRCFVLSLLFRMSRLCARSLASPWVDPVNTPSLTCSDLCLLWYWAGSSLLPWTKKKMPKENQTYWLAIKTQQISNNSGVCEIS